MGIIISAEVGVNTLKKLPKLPKNIPLRAIEHTATEVKVIAEGQTTSLFTVSKEGVYTSERWFTGTGATTKLDEVTNVHFMERGSSFKTGTIEFVEDANGEKWLKGTTTASRYANYPNIQKLATHVLDELDGLLWDDAILSSLEADLGKSTLKQALEGDLDLLYLWQTSKQTTLANLTLLKTQLQQIGYSDFKTIDFLKNADGTYYGSKLIYADPATIADVTIVNSPNELAFLEEICNKYSTKAYTPVSTKQIAVDGVLELNNEFIQLKSIQFSDMIGYINKTYKSANTAGVKEVHLYIEIKDITSNVSSVVYNWKKSAPSTNVKMVNDGTISTITVKTNTGWVDLDLTLIK
ncbi:hypothetical protein GCM10027035_12180 [Emticicia sediminis]